MQTPLLKTAATFYAGMAAVAMIWCAIAGRPVFWVGEPPSFASVMGWAVVGVILGLLIVALSHFFLDRFSWAQSLSDWFSSVLGPVSWKDALVLALLSGFGEEMLFRGALQPTLGLLPATIIFGLMHWPPRKELRPWTVVTTILGLFFGIATELSGHLTAAIVAHFVINFINLTAIGKLNKTGS